MAVATIDIGELLVSREGVCGGRPCIRGSRVTVHTVAARYAAGQSVEEMLSDWPHITRAGIHAALAYYFANKESVDLFLAQEEAFGERMIAEQERRLAAEAPANP